MFHKYKSHTKTSKFGIINCLLWICNPFRSPAPFKMCYTSHSTSSTKLQACTPYSSIKSENYSCAINGFCEFYGFPLVLLRRLVLMLWRIYRIKPSTPSRPQKHLTSAGNIVFVMFLSYIIYIDIEAQFIVNVLRYSTYSSPLFLPFTFWQWYEEEGLRNYLFLESVIVS